MFLFLSSFNFFIMENSNNLLMLLLAFFIFIAISCDSESYENDPPDSQNGAKTISISSPKGGENWEIGSEQTVSWTYTGQISDVTIQLYKNLQQNNALNVSVLSGSNGFGTYKWTIPANITPGDDYKVKISDANESSVFDISGSDFSIISTSTPINGAVWGQITNSAPWGPRGYFKALVFDNKIWILPGTECYDIYANSIWNSSDGINWTMVTNSVPFGSRWEYSAVVFDNKMWILGGRGPSGESYKDFNDVWSSSDGINWTQVTNSAGWSARNGHASVVFNNKMWVITDEAWSSTNGVSWTKESDFGGSKSHHTCVVFDNKIWKICGYNTRKNVFYSADGIVWIQATADPGWSGRHAHVSIVGDNKIWTIGGIGAWTDVWSSENGSTWIQATSNGGFDKCNFDGVNFNDKLWIFGGAEAGTWRSDVWCTQ